MSKTHAFLGFFLLVVFFCPSVSAQKKARVETRAKIGTGNSIKDCADVKAGQIIAASKPVYPAEAKTAAVGGTVRIVIKIDEKGVFSEVESIDGHRLLQAAAIDAARKSKFSPTFCDGVAKPVSGVLTYDFILLHSTGKYFAAAKAADFTDVKNDSPYYEIVSNLTENYRLAFGYDDKKFYPEMPLTRGDFAHFLRLTLDLLADRAERAGKLPREINLFNSYNPQKITANTGVADFKAKDAFSDSVKTLLLKYDIAPVNERNEFQGKVPFTNNEVIEIWSKIFGSEAIPVNFELVADGDRLISRGEFALFLQESLQVLTYKVLP